MAFTYGFYNYDRDDSDLKIYDAVQMSQLFDGIITDGVYGHVGTCFRVSAAGDEVQNTVIIGTGRAWFNHTWNYNDSNFILENAPLAPLVSPRIDAVVLDINSNKNSRTNSIIWVTGTSASVKPTLVHTATQNQYALAYIHRRVGVEIIEEADIENAVGTPETPYVTGILETLDTEQLLSAFRTEFNRLTSELTSELDNIISDAEATANAKLRDIEDIRGDCLTLKNSITTMRNTSSSLSSEINMMYSSSRTSYNRLQEILTQAETDIDELTSKISTLESSVSSQLTNWLSQREAQDDADLKNWMDDKEEEYQVWFDALTVDLVDTPISDQQFGRILEVLGLEEE